MSSRIDIFALVLLVLGFANPLCAQPPGGGGPGPASGADFENWIRDAEIRINLEGGDPNPKQWGYAEYDLYLLDPLGTSLVGFEMSAAQGGDTDSALLVNGSNSGFLEVETNHSLLQSTSFSLHSGVFQVAGHDGVYLAKPSLAQGLEYSIQKTTTQGNALDGYNVKVRSLLENPHDQKFTVTYSVEHVDGITDFDSARLVGKETSAANTVTKLNLFRAPAGTDGFGSYFWVKIVIWNEHEEEVGFDRVKSYVE